MNRQQAQDPSEVFLHNAQNIFATAENVFLSTGSLDSTSILISPGGGFHVVCGTEGWSLDSLQAHHGAQAAYRVSQRYGRVQLEGRAGSRTCLFETTKPDGAAWLLLANTCHYDVAAAPRIAGALAPRRTPYLLLSGATAQVQAAEPTPISAHVRG
ncbi:MAG: hypothetical protein FJW31_18560 [Acidobacteria bacterium]|nr:hypothetical protein [Acidobacteriota bacterium]